MTDLRKTIASLHQRIDTLRQGFNDSLSGLVGDLDQVSDAAGELLSVDETHSQLMRQLEERAEGQNELIETLTEEAQEARGLRMELRERELEIEKLKAELGSKMELLKALRQQLSEIDELKTAARKHEKNLFEQRRLLQRKQTELDNASRRISALEDELTAATEQSADRTAVENAELVALRSELDARKTMIKSLRADAERARSLETQLAGKREAVNVLEQSIDQHAATIAELRRSAEAWKKKYQAAKGVVYEGPGQTLAEPPPFTDTEIEALEALKLANGVKPPPSAPASKLRGALKEAPHSKADSTT